MDINYIKKLSAADRADLLSADAVLIQETKYTKPLTPEEVAFQKDLLAQKAIDQATLLDELAQVKKDYDAKLKPIKLDIAQALKAIKYKAIDCEGTLYSLADYDDQMIHVVDGDGNLINSRRMLPNERQLRLQPNKSETA